MSEEVKRHACTIEGNDIEKYINNPELSADICQEFISNIRTLYDSMQSLYEADIIPLAMCGIKVHLQVTWNDDNDKLVDADFGAEDFFEQIEKQMEAIEHDRHNNQDS